MINDEQRALIKYLCGVGYGWAKFACSVERSGKCTDAQEKTMRNMKARIKSQAQYVRAMRRCGNYLGDGLGGVGCSDTEAMSFGEYF